MRAQMQTTLQELQPTVPTTASPSLNGNMRRVIATVSRARTFALQFAAKSRSASTAFVLVVASAS